MGSPVIWNGTFAKSLRSQFNLNDSAYVLTGTSNPTIVSTNAPQGSIYLQTGGSGGSLFRKLDSGTSTNWAQLSGNNSGDITLTAVGAAPSANAATLSGQALTLQPFDSTHPGVVAASGGGTSNFLRADGTWTTPTGGGSSSAPNNLVNGAFDFWQAAGTSKTIANTITTYVPDQWYVTNGLGSGGVITFSQTTGAVAGSQFGASVQVTTAPGAGTSSGINLVQVIENPQTLRLYNQSVSANCQIKALGNVNQITMRIVYATTETKPTLSNTIGSAFATSVSTGSFTSCSLTNVAIGTTPTTSGVIGLYIFVSGVSSGNISDLNNGFIIEQASLNLGSTANSSFQRAGSSVQQELALCQRYYWKSFALTTTPANAAGVTGILVFNQSVGSATGAFSPSIVFPSPMRASPTVTVYNPNNNNSQIHDFSDNSDWSATGVDTAFYNNFGLIGTSPGGSSVGSAAGYHATADARI